MRPLSRVLANLVLHGRELDYSLLVSIGVTEEVLQLSYVGLVLIESNRRVHL